ncbi:MAG: glycosyltransferase family 39 protein [Candidatus Eisenbacteria bacterium]|nr:glycosyltransferase family 39 protein [Candidatus Eisenbacteria bacterium]
MDRRGERGGEANGAGARLPGRLGARTALFLFLLGLAARLVYLWEIRGGPIADVLLIDSETYDRFARMILEGRFRGEAIYSMNPLYPWYLAAVYKVGGGPEAARVVQAVLGALNAVLLARIGAPLFGRAAGIAAGAALALYGPAVFYAGALLTPVLIETAFLAALLALTAWGERGRPVHAALAGLAVGIAALGRGNAALYVPVALAFFLARGGGRRRALAHWALFAAVAAAPPLLVTARNALVEGRFVPIAANYAAFYIGHNADARGLYQPTEYATSARFAEEVLGTRGAVSRELGRPVTLAGSARHLFRKGLAWSAAHPGAEARLAARKFFYFWNAVESPTNLNFHFARDFSTLLRALPLTFGFVGPLAVLGMIYRRRDWRRHLHLTLLVAIVLATALLFFVSAEYRMPAAPVLLLFAAAAVEEMVRRARRRGARALLFPALILAPLLLFAHLRDDLLDAQTWKRVDYLNFGTLYRDRGEGERAEAMFLGALRIDPRFGPAHAALAALYAAAGDDLRAARHLELAERYALSGQYEGAAPEISDATRALAAAAERYRAGDYAAALVDFERLLASFEERGDSAAARSARNNIGLCFWKTGDLGRAERTFRELLAEDSSYVKGYANLARVRVAAGDRAEAEALLLRALRIEPDNERLRAQLERIRAGAKE